MTRRIDRVNALLRQEISVLVAHELRDPRLSSLVSVTRVDTSKDLRHAKVYVSVLGDDSEKGGTIRALKSAAGFIHRNMRRRLALRAVPSLAFYLDESIEQGAEILELIRQVAPGPETGSEQ